jgi:purine-binding chemotaxis protein CheW
MRAAAKRDAKTSDAQQPSVSQYLVFCVSNMEMAVSLACISEIVPYERVSPVPGTPPYVRGVVHVRGRVIPVVDLAQKLGRTPEPPGKRTCILMFELSRSGQSLPMGIVMDNVAKLLDVPASQISAPPRFGADVDGRLLAGLVPTERGMLPLLDVERVFGDEELAQVAAVAET